MKKILVIILIVSLFLVSKEQIQEWTFHLTALDDFTDRCNGEIKCIEAVEAQVGDCLNKAKWQDYMSDTEDPAKQQYFARTLTACFIDEAGKPYFVS